MKDLQYLLSIFSAIHVMKKKLIILKTFNSVCVHREELVLRHRDEIAVGFNGKGYFKGSNRYQRPKPYYNTVLSFKTLDEDALLFLAVHDEKVRTEYI